MPLSAPTKYSLALKAAFRRLVEACGGQESVILIPGMPLKRHQALSEYGNIDEPGQARIDVIALMEADCGKPLVTELLARATHHVLVPLPAVVGSHNPLGRVTGAAMKETSEVFAKLGKFLDDGKLSAAEGRQLDKEIDQAVIQLLALRAQVDREAGSAES
jgi:hypothetical protein